MGEEDNKKDMEKQQKHEDTKESLKTGAKMAAKTYAGPLGGMAVDLASKTKRGNAALNMGAHAFNNVGLGRNTNFTNKAMSSLDDSDEKDNISSDPKSSMNSHTKESGNNSPTDAQESATDSASSSSKMFSFIKKRKVTFISIFGGFLLFLIMIMAVIIVIWTPVGAVIDFFSGIVDNIIGFFSEDQERQMQDYYKTLQEVQVEMNKKYNVCIDVNLITAALTVNTDIDKWLEDGEGLVTDSDDYDPTNPDNNNSEITLEYKKMKKNVKLLAKMQIQNNIYSLDEQLKKSTGYYCSTQSSTELVREETKDSFKTDLFDWMKGADLASETAEKIASHDIGGIQAFFTSKSGEEKNYAYHIYHPPFSSDGSCTDSYAKSMLPNSKAVLSIGDLETMEDSVFYWNLVNSFVPSYYKEYISDNEPQRTEDIKKIAEQIYLLYADSGPGQTCSVSYAGPSSLCPYGITVENEGTFDFEEYIAGVVSNEAYSSEGMEALKAQAVAARTYALNKTDYCRKAIPNNTNAQTFTRNINNKARTAVNATRGEVLVDKEGKIFSSMYDSFCYDDKDCPDAIKNSDGTYSVTYTKLPYGERHTITLKDSSQYKRILPGKGHAHGMSQLLSYQMAKEGKSYREILSYFYSEGVEIRLVLSPITTDGATIIQGPINNYFVSANTTIDAFNQNIYSQVIKSGISTREGVVAAATTLVSEFYNLTGYKLPYELLPSGKYSGYGIDSNWGTNTGNSSYPLNGLDCSGFISWAMHNGGYTYEVKSAQGWGNTGTKRSWNTGVIDSSAKPGDLIYNQPPPQGNGTTGHIRMIIGVTDQGYVVAEASGKKNGIRITNISFKSTGSYYLVDMSNYYATQTKVTDYPI